SRGGITPLAATVSGDHFDVTVAAPSGVDFGDIALLADAGTLMLDAGAKVLGAVNGFATIVNSSNLATTLQAGPGATDVGDVWSVGDVTVIAGAHVHGFIRSNGTVTAPAGSVDDPSTGAVSLSTAFALAIDFLATPPAPPTIPAGATTVLPPGDYAATS